MNGVQREKLEGVPEGVLQHLRRKSRLLRGGLVSSGRAGGGWVCCRISWRGRAGRRRLGRVRRARHARWSADERVALVRSLGL